MNFLLEKTQQIIVEAISLQLRAVFDCFEIDPCWRTTITRDDVAVKLPYDVLKNEIASLLSAFYVIT